MTKKKRILKPESPEANERRIRMTKKKRILKPESPEANERRLARRRLKWKMNAVWREKVKAENRTYYFANKEKIRLNRRNPNDREHIVKERQVEPVERPIWHYEETSSETLLPIGK